ncbi:hypothetical protein Plhal304r1_c019g0066781 [Plasmopara halstedii]
MSFFLSRQAGDHLVHSMTLSSGTPLLGLGYWKLSRYLLDYRRVIVAIEKEADQMRDKLRCAE